MKKLLAIILALVAVFCMFTGCNSDGDNNGNGNNANITDNTGNGENTGGNENDKPEYTVVSPITDGGSFDGGGY